MDEEEPPARLLLTLTWTTASLGGLNSTTGVEIFGDRTGISVLEMWALTKVKARLGLVSRMDEPMWVLGLDTSLLSG